MAQIANPDPTPEDDNENDRPNYYLWAAVITLSLLALPETRLQSIFKMAVWTVIVLGVLTPMIWPFVRDTLSRFIFAMICIVHFLLMRIVYARLPQDGYIAIGFVILVEFVVLVFLRDGSKYELVEPSENSSSFRIEMSADEKQELSTL